MLCCFFVGACASANEAKPYGITLDSQKVCAAMQQTLGQLLYVTVDGFGPNVKQAIHPDYVKLVKLLNIGGVVPRFGSKNPAVIAASTEALFRAPKQPLLLGLSKTQLTLNTALGEKSITVGLDNVAGWHKSQPKTSLPKSY